MTTPFGQISLNDVQTEFGGSPPISINEYYGGGGLTPSGINVPTSGQISFNDLRGKSKSIAGTSGILTGAGYWFDYVLPATVGSILYIYCIAGGGGGGGGTNRTANTGRYSGGGGGGAGECRFLTLYGIPIVPGSSLRCYIGTGGSAGGGRDGGYSGGSSGGGGGDTYVQYNGNTYCVALGGNGGTVSQVVNYPYLSQTTSGGGRNGGPVTTTQTFWPHAGGETASGTGRTGAGGEQKFAPESGQQINAYWSFRTFDSWTVLPSLAELNNWPQGGGYGGRGYNFTDSSGRNIVQGSRSVGATGNDREPWSQLYYLTQLGQYTDFTAYGPVNGIQSSSWGAGGGGGSKNNEYVGSGGGSLNGTNGTQGAIAIYWD